MASIRNLLDEIAILAKNEYDSFDTKNHAKLLHSIHKLQLAAEKPVETARRTMYQPPTNIALRLAVELGLLNTLLTGCLDGSSMTASSLAQPTHAEEMLVVRIMRCLTAMGICDEAGPRKYSPNKVTGYFTSDRFGDGVKDLYDTVVPAAAGLLENLHALGPRVSKTAQEAPFTYNEQTTVFQWLKERPEQRQQFDNYMAARRRETPEWFEIWPVSDTLGSGLHKSAGTEEVLFVDVGGSHGYDLMKFREKYGSGLRGRLILQDLVETIESLRDLSEGIEAMTYDFFTPQPIIARIYYFGTVCHDWNDESCIKFLTNTANAMEKGYSTLLIYDYVVPETGASVQMAAMDMQMMVLMGGMERPESQWRAILQASGLDLVRVWSPSGPSESVIEAQLL